MAAQVLSRIKRNRDASDAQAARLAKIESTISSHFEKMATSAAGVLAELLAQQKDLSKQAYQSDEVARAVVEEFELSIRSLGGDFSGAKQSDHYAQATFKATREHALDTFIRLAEHMAFGGQPPAVQTLSSLRAFREMAFAKDPAQLAQASELSKRYFAGKITDAQLHQEIQGLFQHVCASAPDSPHWNDRVYALKSFLDRARRARASDLGFSKL